MQSDRWVTVSPSQFTHEAEGLNLVKALLPDAEPYRAWSNFEFRDTHGKWHEVDLLVLGRGTLYLVELKYYRGTLSGNDQRWRRDGQRSEDSPLKLAHRKAQYFATLLKDRLREFWRERGVPNQDTRNYIPYVQEAVFLHHPNMRCELPQHSRIGLYGLDGNEERSGLAPISDLLLAPAKHKPVPEHNARLLAGLIKEIGLVPRRQREVGSWVIDDEPLGDGEGWQDWPAFHRQVTTDRYRIRFHIPKPGSTRADEQKLHRRIDYEYRLLSRLHHDGLVVPRDLISDELGSGLVYHDDGRYRRLDLWLADQTDGLSLSRQLDMIRQLAEALSYAHRHRVVHRGLAPSAVSVRERSGGGLALTVANWDAVGTVPNTQLGNLTSSGLSGIDQSPDFVGAELTDEDQLFEAPEGRWSPTADRIRLDVFALGAMAFYILTNQTLPAQDRGALVERLRRDRGLDLAAELPQIHSELRALVLAATDPRPSERMPSVGAFLEKLAEAEASLTAPTVIEGEDPLEARPGSVIGHDGRFTYVRKLGSGSTAVGILVRDASAGEAERVLKVAKDSDANERLQAEKNALGLINHERIATLNYAVEIGFRHALVLQFAGAITLADELASKRGRLSLDLLERWGDDLLNALAALDEAGVSHRDIKPSNLGVHRASKSKTETHLMLFDFSMAGAGARAIHAGTPPYLDPFLGQDGRITYDSAAERYGAAVVLYEMATGRLPQYGTDPEANPASVSDDVTIPAEVFDPSITDELTGFFTMALSRDVAKRHDTAEDMRRAWRGVFRSLVRYSGDTEQKVAKATPDSTLGEAGLSARAVSVLEPEGVVTVADLLSLDSARLNRVLSRETKTTREEIRKRVTAWRKELGTVLQGNSRTGEQSTLADPLVVAESLVVVIKRSRPRQEAARLLLGLEPGLDAFASQQELAAAIGRSAPRGHQLIKELQDGWGRDDGARTVLDQLATIVTRALHTLGGVASTRTLTGEILAALPDLPAESADRGARVAAGLLRCALDRYHEHVLAETEQPLAKRRHRGRLALLAHDTVLLDAAEAAAARADELVTAAERTGEPLVAQQRAAREVRDQFGKTFEDEADPGRTAPPITDLRLVRLAAHTSQHAAISARGELHPRTLPAATAVRIALTGIPLNAELTPDELTARVRVRFPELDPLPARPDLDSIVDSSGSGLRYAKDRGAYCATAAEQPDSTGFPTRTATVLPARTEASLGRGDHLARVLTGSVSAHSFLALGVSPSQPASAERVATALLASYGGIVLDVTGMLIEEMRATAQASNLPWHAVRDADAAQQGSRSARGLHALVAQTVPKVTARIDELALDAGTASGEPLILTELSPLARYGHLNVIARWSDLAARRSRPVWLVLPQLTWMRGAVVDGKPLQLGSDGQFVELNADWLATREGEHGAEQDTESASKGIR